MKRIIIVLFVALMFFGCGASDDGSGGNEDGDAEDGSLPDGDSEEEIATDGDEEGSETQEESEDTEQEDDELLPGDPGYTFPADFLAQEVEWEECFLFDDTRYGTDKAECGYIEVPVYWSKPDGDTLKIYVKRLLGTAEATRQIWLLEGGPGGAGTSSFPGYMQFLGGLDPELDMYVVDHRGVGLSARMGCPDQEAKDSQDGVVINSNEMPDCLEYLANDWGYPTDAFTVTEAATDLAFMVELMKEENKDRFVYGVSYGTYWAHRYAQLFPDQADGVILDSIAPSDETWFDRFDILGENTMEQYFEMCRQDEFCKSKMTDDPVAFAKEVLESYRDGHCSKLKNFYGLIPEYMQYTAFQLGRSWSLRVLVPALYYRLNRCDEKDIQVIGNLAYAILGGGASLTKAEEESDLRDSQLLGSHIGTSEFISPEALTINELIELNLDMIVSIGLGPRIMADNAIWPKYEPDKYYMQWASTDVPMLMMNGTLDLQTPIEIGDNVTEHLTGEHQYFAEVANGNHGIITESPVKTSGLPPCGTQMILSFIKDPLTQPDMSCLEDLKPISFTDTEDLAIQVLQSADLWDNIPVTLSCEMPEDFMTLPEDNYTALTFRGRIGDANDQNSLVPGIADSQTMLNGNELSVSDYSAYTYLSSASGTDNLVLVTLGDVTGTSANHIYYKTIRLKVARSALLDMMENEQYEIALGDIPDAAGNVSNFEEKISGSDRYIKSCPTGVFDNSEAGTELFICHDENTDFSPGEHLEIAVNADLLTNAEQLPDCTCTKNSFANVIDCSEFDSVVTDIKSAVPQKLKVKKPAPSPGLSSRPVNLTTPYMPIVQ